MEYDFNLEFKESNYQRFFNYIPSLFMVDMMDNAFREKGITLPSNLQVLDVGAGEWRYVHSLYNFLINYQGRRNVQLLAVDVQGNEHHKKGRN